MAVRPIVTTTGTGSRNNTIVTRGFGRKNNIVTRGFVRGFFQEVVRLLWAGQSGLKRSIKDLEDIIISAKLINVNDDVPTKKIEGFMRLKYDRATKHVVTMIEGIKRKLKDIKVTIKRIR